MSKDVKYLEVGDRPWGVYYVLEDESTYKLKRIIVQPGGRLSYQYHKHRSEVWTIVKGVGRVTLDGVEKDFSVGEVVFVPQGKKHRIENPTEDDLVFIEVQTGTYFGEDDIIRLDDIYDRVSPKGE